MPSVPAATQLARGTPGLGLAFSAQAAWLIAIASNPAEAVAALLALAGVLAVPAFARSRGAPGWSDAALLTGALGGLAMIVGSHFDQGSGAGPEWCEPAPTGGRSALFTWSHTLMLAACLGACHWLARREPSFHILGAKALRHLGCLAGMWLGMILGTHLLRLFFGNSVGGAAALHVAMLSGMMAGAGVTSAVLWPRRADP